MQRLFLEYLIQVILATLLFFGAVPLSYANINMSMGIYGSDASSLSASADSSQSSNSSVTYTNAGISGGTITINTKDKTTIAGANIHANDELTLNTGSLDVRSVQDSTSSKSSAQGMSMSDSGSGSINGSLSRASSKDTVLTSITGGKVKIDVQEGTTIKGALIAAVDAEGNDNGNLSLTTKTLEVSSLNNTKDNKSMSANISGGGTASIDASADNSHSKTKTLATLGSGNINVADEANSDTAMLNRDINDNEVDIYDIESHKGIKGSLDTNLLTEQGRDKIAEDIMKSGMIVDTVRQIVMDDTVGITEFFSETEKQHKTYEAVKEKIATDPALAAQLQDPNLNPQEKEAMLNGITDAVMVKLGYTTHENVIVANANDPRAGHISAESGKTTAYINDANAYVDSTGKLVTVAGHEASHAIDSQSDENYAEGTREDYATNYGENLTNFTDMALDINGYDGMATSNNHVGNRSEYVTNNTTAYNQLDKAKGDDFIVTGTLLAATALYTTYAGDGNPVKGVEAIGAGSDPLSETIASGAEKAVKMSYQQFPEATQATLDTLGKVGEGVSAIVKYIDEKTGKVVSTEWNNLDESTQNKIKGSGKIVSVFIPGSSVKALAKMKKVDVNGNISASDLKKVNVEGSNPTAKNSWNEFQKGTKGNYSTRKEAANDYKELRDKQSPFPKGEVPQNRELKPGEKIKMVLSEGQSPNKPGGFATQNNIPSQQHAREKLAITNEFKKDVSKVQEYEVIKPLAVKDGKVGPQIDRKTGDYWKGGETQLKLEVPAKDRSKYIKPVGKPREIR